jgi:DNA segregation ATPase FtsK/SpoIIIE and related proteins
MKSNHKEQSSLKPMGFGLSLVFTGLFMAALWIALNYLLPMVSKTTNAPPPLAWYSSTTIAVFLPMLLIAVLMPKLEKQHFSFSRLKNRLRIRKMTGEDWIWIFISIMLAAILTMVLFFVGKNNISHFSTQPALMQIYPLAPEENWILLAWFPLFLFNLLSEELFWRGYLYARQQEKFGKKTWLFNGLLWLIFRIPLGLTFLLVALPSTFLTTYAFQKTHNLKVSIAVNGAMSGLGFMAIALGYI